MSVAPGSYFFMHIMKTAGTSFAQHLEPNFADDEIYPHPSTKGPVHMEQYWKVAELRALTAEDRARIRVYAGHFPYVASRIVDADTTLTILRHPVARTYSALRHLERHFPQHHGKALEAIYEDDWHNPTWLRNYQVKLFALTLEDDPTAHIDVVVVDEARFRVAVGHLEEMALFGLTERYDEFTAEVARRYGWSFRDAKRLQVGGEADDVPAALRRRIEEDSAADVAFYEHARSLVEARGTATRR